MNDLATFFFEDNAVRTVKLGDAIWWLGRDIAGCLGYLNVSEAIRDHCPNAKTFSELCAGDGGNEQFYLQDINHSETLGLKSHMLFIPLSDVFRLVARSKLPAAIVFERWVFEEVLPSIMKTGRYAVEPEPSLEPEWHTKQKIDIVTEARRTHGKSYAAALWRSLGLPTVEETVSRPEQTGMMKHIFDFLEECTVEDPRSELRSDALHRKYQQWAASNGAPYIVSVSFGKYLVKAGLSRRRSGGSVYLGIRIVNPLDVASR